MADRTGEMAVNDHAQSPNPFVSFFQNLMKVLPLPKFEPKPRVVDSGLEGKGKGEGEGEVISKKVDVVRFSGKAPIIPPPLKLEAEESDSSSSPAVLWQVYALGGIILLRWAWARWNERRNRDGAPDEEPSLAED